MTVPPQAAAVGYNTLVLGPNIIVGTTPDPITSYPQFTHGVNWVPYTFTGTSWTNIGFTVNPDGSVSLDGSGQAYGNGLCTAAAGNANLTTNRLNITGTAFGGGFYAEASMKGTGPMSFWANDIETMNGASVNVGPNPWPGQASGYGDWIELDIAEFDTTASYGIAYHNWYGDIGGPDASTNFNKVLPNPTPDYTQYHLYGALWVPATATTQGYLSYYFDGTLVSTITWNQYNPILTPPPAYTIQNNNVTWPNPQTWGGGSAFSVLDTLHPALILGGAQGSTVTFQSINVWQATTVNNITTISPTSSSISAQTISPTVGDLINNRILANFSNTNFGYIGASANNANALPIVITEFGYSASGGTANGTTVDISTQGKNILNGILNAWNQNIRLVCLYELYDQGNHYGLMQTYGTPYTSATYLSNFTKTLADSGANNVTFTPSTFNYTLLNTTSTMTSTLLQKSIGNTQIIVWNNVDNWNVAAGTANTIPTTNISINLPSGASGTILVFDPTIAAVPVATATSARTITFAMKDYPMIVDFSNVINNSGGNFASRAKDFLNIIGINGNVGGNSSIYINSGSSIVSDLTFLGINIYRDGLELSPPQLSIYQTLANAGIKMVVTPPNSAANGVPYTLNVPSLINGINTFASFSNTFLYALEGCNKPNTYPITFNNATSNTNSFMPVANFMNAYFTAVNSISAYNTIPIYSVSDILVQPDNTGMQYLIVPNGASTGGVAGSGANYGGGGAGTSIPNGVPGEGGQGIIVLTNIPLFSGFAWLDGIVYDTLASY